MDFAGAMVAVRKERALEEQLKRMADGCSARLRLTIESRYGDQMWFYWRRGKRAFVVTESECLDKTDEEITALVEKHIPGYAAKIDAARAEKKRRQRIRVQYNNQQISFKREQRRKHAKCEVCRTPITGAIRRRKYCSGACRQRASRYDL